MGSQLETTRREFMRSALQSTAGVAACSGITFLTRPERVFGANDRVRVAVCGVHGRGMDHIEGFRAVKNTEVAAVCDPDEGVMEQRLAEIEKAGLPKPRAFVDVRKLLEDKSIDAISIATPNHWHSLMGIWACQAGKDSYIEKPCCHNLWEGKQLVKAATKYGRIVEHGSQIRSAPALREAVRMMRDGFLGDVYMARGLCFKWRNTIGRAKEEPVPKGVHYDLWTGPAKMLSFTKNHFHYNWHWNWNYGNGDLGNQGIHQVDVARWGLGVTFPNRVSASGGHFMFDDDQETPNTLNCAFEFDMPDGKRKLLEMEVRHWITNREAGIGSAAFGKPQGPISTSGMGAIQGDRNTIGDIFYGSKGYLATGDEDLCAFQTWLGERQEPGPQRQAAGDHYANFIECVRSRRKEDLNAPIDEGYISTALVHLANASYRLRRSLKFDPETQMVVGDEEANRLLAGEDRGYRENYRVPSEV